MQVLKQEHVNMLEAMIYNLLIGNPKVGLGEMGDCEDAARELVKEFLELSRISIID